MALRKTNVSIQVDRDFFEKVFEPSRMKIQKKLGVKVSQLKFTRMIFKNNMDLTPKLNFNMNQDISLRNLKLKKQYGIKSIKRKK